MTADPRADHPSPNRRRWGAALAVSGLFHLIAAAIGVVTWRGEPAPPVPAPPWKAAIEISLAQSPTARPGRPPPERSPPAPQRRPARPAEAGPMQRPAEPGGPPSPAAPEPRLPPPAPPEPGVPGHPLDLSFEGLASAAQQRAASSGGTDLDAERLMVPTPAPEHAGGRRSPDDLHANADRRADAEANVRLGRVDPILYDYLRAARTRLEPEADRLAEKLPLGPGATVKGWARGYLGRVDEVNHHSAADLPSTPDDDFGKRPDVLGAYNEAEHQARSGAEERTAEVCLGIRPDHPAVVTLRRSSTHAELDRLAVESFRAAGDARPAGAGVRPGVACYLVRISAFRMPPAPTLSLRLKNGRPDVVYPLKRLTKVTVELLSADDGLRPRTSPLLHAP